MENRETMLVVSEPCFMFQSTKGQKFKRNCYLKEEKNHLRAIMQWNFHIKKEGITQFLNAKRQLERDCEGVIVQ